MATLVMHHEDILARMQKEADRAAVILGGAVLDGHLRNLLDTRFNELREALLEDGYSISNSAGRIKVVRALDWVTKEVFEDLERIRKIRNTFAHSPDEGLTLERDDVAALCAGIRIIDSYQRGLEVAKVRQSAKTSATVFDSIKLRYSAPRERFRLAIDFYAQHLSELLRQAPPFGPVDVFAEALNLGSGLHFVTSATGIVGGPMPPAGESPNPHV